MNFVSTSTLGIYKPKKYFKAQNELSKKIISLKNGDLSAKLFFYIALKNRFKAIEGNYILATVPTSMPGKPNPLNSVVERLCAKFPNFQNGCDLLYKKNPTESLCKGGARDYYSIRESIGFDYIMPIAGKKIILLDDVVTTGVTINAARHILLQNRAKDVIPFALGLTARHIQFRKK